VSLTTCKRSVSIPFGLLLALTFSSAGTLLSAQTIGVKLIDGRSGHPIANTCVNVWVGNEQRDALAIPTDKDGVAHLHLTENDSEVNTQEPWKTCGEFGVVNPVVKYKDFIKVNVSYFVCEPRGANFSWLEIKRIPTKELLEQGVATANTCGKPTASPKPGEVIIFVRPLNFWEKLKQ
jgi:hypothetical protein